MERSKTGRGVDRRVARIGARIGSSVLIALFVAGVWPAPTVVAAPRVPAGVTDITTTASGRALAREAAARFVRLAATIAADDLVVLRDASGITIGPRTAGYTVLPATSLAGVAQVQTVATTIGRPSALKVANHVAAAGISGSWSLVANQCFSRISDTFSWLDHCYTMYRLVADNDAGRDWFALAHFGTMQANPPWVMNAASIGTLPVGATPQAWADWAPRSDMVGPCHQITLSIFTPVGGIGDATTQCETWSITKSATAGGFSVKWDGRGSKAARELSMLISVSVPQNGWPQWSLPASVSGSMF